MTPKPFAHYEGEPDEVTEAHVRALETELKTQQVAADPDRASQVQAELDRLRPSGGGTKRSRLRGEKA